MISFGCLSVQLLPPHHTNRDPLIKLAQASRPDGIVLWLVDCTMSCKDREAKKVGRSLIMREGRNRPPGWLEQRKSIRNKWLSPLYAIDWGCNWTAYYLSKWAFLEILEYLGALSVLVAVIFYFSEAGNRIKQKHFQAWQVINTAQGKGGSGGRIEALHELNVDGVSLVGVDLSNAFLQEVELLNANLLRANFDAADLRVSVFKGSNMEYASLRSANFRGADLTNANLERADLEDSDLVGATLTGANLRKANLKNSDLRNTDLQGIHWEDIRAIDAANVYGVRNAPHGFVDWALRCGAVAVPGED
jgi:Pentapeptide repeats (8 copies)